jgi:hypothetical protein
MKAIARLRAELIAGDDVWWPRDGIGTGLAELGTRAPQIAAHLEGARSALFELAREVKLEAESEQA